MLKALKGTAGISGMILFIIVGATTFSQILSFSGASNGLVQTHHRPGPVAAMIVVGMMLMLIFLGIFVDQVSMMMITLPIFMPVVQALGIDPVWFGVMFLICMQLGLLLPPHGLLLMTMKGVAPPQVTMAAHLPGRGALRGDEPGVARGRVLAAGDRNLAASQDRLKAGRSAISHCFARARHSPNGRSLGAIPDRSVAGYSLRWSAQPQSTRRRNSKSASCWSTRNRSVAAPPSGPMYRCFFATKKNNSHERVNSIALHARPPSPH